MQEDSQQQDAPVTFREILHLVRGCILKEQANTHDLARPSLKNHKLTSEMRLSIAALTSAAIQGLCAFLVAMNAVKLALGFTSVAAAGGSSLIHSDVVRLALPYVSAALAAATLYVIWNDWRLRKRRESQWRKLPLTKREKWTIGLGLLSAVASWFHIIAEVYSHQRIHPQ